MIDLTGKKYHNLKVFDIEQKVKNTRVPKQICVCDCGKVIRIHHYNLLTGKTKDCGCGQSEKEDMMNSIDKLFTKEGEQNVQ